jgi:putative nucleotidyltransferase with HDIG domain
MSSADEQSTARASVESNSASQPPAATGTSATPVTPLPRLSAEPAIVQAGASFVPLPDTSPSLSPQPSIAPVDALPTVSSAPPSESPIERELVRQLRTGRAALPVLPQVADAALRLANDPDARIDQLARLVDTDPPIAARFMSVANSVSYWRGMIASSTQSAIVRLGLANTRDLLFQVVYAASTHGLKKYQTLVSRSFKRSVTAAIAARVTAQELSLASEYDYMSGLLHDIGEARVYRILDGLAVPDGPDAVKRLVKKYHCVAGAEIAMAWKLPTAIVDACAAHHDEAAAANPHVRLVMIADAIVEAIDAAALAKPQDFARFEELGVAPDVARGLIERTRKGVGENKNSLRP